jgi:hypothetical protein
VLGLSLRRHVPALTGLLSALGGRVRALSIGGVSIEFARAPELAASWHPTWNRGFDIRRELASVEVVDSTADHFSRQLSDPAPASYAVVDVGRGDQWLTSRLHVISVLMRRSKGLRAIVFVHGPGEAERRYLGWCDVETVRFALGRAYPWLEQAFAAAQSELLACDVGEPGEVIQVSSDRGAWSRPLPYGSEDALIMLLRRYLTKIQTTVGTAVQFPGEWTDLPGSGGNNRERARWLTRDLVEELFGHALVRDFIPAAEIDGQNVQRQVERVLGAGKAFVAVVEDQGRFRELLDRGLVLERVARAAVQPPVG